MINVDNNFIEPQKLKNIQPAKAQGQNKGQSYLLNEPIKDTVVLTRVPRPQPKKSDDGLLALLIVGLGLVVAGVLFSRSNSKLQAEAKDFEKQISKLKTKLEMNSEANIARRESRKEKTIQLNKLRTKVAKGVGREKLDLKNPSKFVNSKDFDAINNEEVLKDLYSLLKAKAGKSYAPDTQKDIVKVLNKLYEVSLARSKDVSLEKGKSASSIWAKNKLSKETDILLDYYSGNKYLFD